MNSGVDRSDGQRAFLAAMTGDSEHWQVREPAAWGVASLDSRPSLRAHDACCFSSGVFTRTARTPARTIRLQVVAPRSSTSRCLQLSEQHCAHKSLEAELQFRVFLAAGPGPGALAQRGPGRAAAEMEAASLPLALAPAGIVPVHQALHLRPSRSPSRP